MFILQYKKIFFVIAGLFVSFALAGIFTQGLNWGLDFTGRKAAYNFLYNFLRVETKVWLRSCERNTP